MNPIALRENIDIFGENARVVLPIESNFGTVLFIPVGATLVGSINFTAHEGQHVNKGDELGYFAFGGSTVIVLFKKGTVVFDSDILYNSRKPIETLVHMGYRVGVHSSTVTASE